MNPRMNLDSYIEILTALRYSKTIKQLGECISFKPTAIYQTVYYLQDRGLIRENGSTLVQSKKNKIKIVRAGLYITTDKGRKYLAVLEN